MADNITCTDLYEHVMRHPDYRIVKGVPRDNDVCTPLKFMPGGEQLCFAVDLASTAMHHHAMCTELIDLLGDELPEELALREVLFLDIGVVERKLGEEVEKIAIDADAKWIKLYT